MINKTNFLLVLIPVIFLFCSCQSKSTSIAEAPLLENNSTTKTPEVEGTTYSDSFIQQQVQRNLEAQNPQPIDTFETLHSISFKSFPMSKLTHFDIDLLDQHQAINHPLSKAQKQLLQGTDYFMDASFAADFNTFVFYNKYLESHYGTSLVLYTISKTSNQKDQLLLAQFYGNENYEKIISSDLIAQDTIQRKIVEYFGPRNADGFMEENSKTETKIERYIIRANGSIEMQQGY